MQAYGVGGQGESSAGRLPGQMLLVLLAVGCCLAVGLAARRHTGSIAFPIDDGYIYSNYVAEAAQGHPFTYNAGDKSGGITGFGWYTICTLAYWLLAPFHSLLGSLGPELVRADRSVSNQAAHLYLAAYLPGALLLAVAALGVYRLAAVALPYVGVGERARIFACWCIGALAAADLGSVWGVMSGLEVPLSSALGVWAVYFLAREAHAGALRWSLLLAALLPLARPDLVVLALAGLMWLAVRAAVLRGGGRRALAHLGQYALATLSGVMLVALIYWVGWGRPLPSSFYAKVGGLRFGGRFFSAVEELLVAGRFFPFVAAGAALAGGMVGFLARPPEPQGTAYAGAAERSRWNNLLLVLVSGAYIGGIMATLPWFGQEDRYLLPVHPFLLVLAGSLVWWVIGGLLRTTNVPASGGQTWFAGAAALLAVLAVLVNYVWATRNYVVQVRNISDAHIAPAVWIAQNAPSGSLIAAEPIGAVHLFSGRPTVDLVGLTSPATLGTYGDWNRAWPALRNAGAGYLLFYPRWFDGGEPPAWAVTERNFEIADNRIAGDNLIAVYRLDWSKWSSP